MARQFEGVSSPYQARFIGQSREEPPESRSGLIMGDFHSSLLPDPVLCGGVIIPIWVIFFATSFLSGLDYGLVFVRPARFPPVWSFSNHVCSPCDQRGELRSGN